MQSIKVTSRPPVRIKKWNHLSQFRWISTKGILVEKTLEKATFQQWAKGSREAASQGPTVSNIRFCSFFKIWIHSMQGWTVATRLGVTGKRSTKRLKHTGNIYKDPRVNSCLLILDLIKPFRS